MRAGQHVSGRRRRIVRALAILQRLALGALLTVVAPAAGTAAERPGSTAIRTPDFDASLSWYQDTLGFRLLSTRNSVQERTAVLERRGFLLEITEVDHPMPAGAETDPQTTAATHVPVIHLLVPDVDREVRQLRNQGVEILEEPRDDIEGEYRIAQIRDNGRHRIELREPLQDDGGFNPIGR